MDKAANYREEKALRFVSYCVLRFRTELTEDQIATELDYTSRGTLYRQLESDGSPICGVCGLLYPDPNHREEHERKRQPKLSTETWIKLPPANAAGGLFRRALKEYDEYLRLVSSEESWLRGKSFRTYNVDRDATELLRRESYTEVK